MVSGNGILGGEGQDFPDNIAMDVADAASALTVGFDAITRKPGLLFMTLISLL